MQPATGEFNLDIGELLRIGEIAGRRMHLAIAILEDRLSEASLSNLNLGVRHGVRFLSDDSSNTGLDPIIVQEAQTTHMYTAFLDLYNHLEFALDHVLDIIAIALSISDQVRIIDIETLVRAKGRNVKKKRNLNLEKKIVKAVELLGSLEFLEHLATFVPIRNAVAHNFGRLTSDYINPQSGHILRWMALIPYMEAGGEKVSMRYGNVIDTHSFDKDIDRTVFGHIELFEKRVTIGERVAFSHAELMELALVVKLATNQLYNLTLEWFQRHRPLLLLKEKEP